MCTYARTHVHVRTHIIIRTYTHASTHTHTNTLKITQTIGRDSWAPHNNLLVLSILSWCFRLNSLRQFLVVLSCKAHQPILATSSQYTSQPPSSPNSCYKLAIAVHWPASSSQSLRQLTVHWRVCSFDNVRLFFRIRSEDRRTPWTDGPPVLPS